MLSTIQLRQILVDFFDESELQDRCFCISPKMVYSIVIQSSELNLNELLIPEQWPQYQLPELIL